MERKSTPFEMKVAPDGDGRFEGYASVFGVVDRGRDEVRPGAFTKSLSARSPKMLWQHDPHQIIGIWEGVNEDGRGLFVKGRIFSEIERGREALTLLREGALDSMSIGYKTIDAEKSGATRLLKEVELFEISLVTFPMLESATVTDVKSIQTVRDFERALRDVGFSQREAKAIAAEGFKGLAAHRDDVGAEAELDGLAPLLHQIRQLQEKTNG